MITLILLLFLTATSSITSQQKDYCYLRSSKCQNCYTLCFERSLENLPSYISQCILDEDYLSLDLSNLQYQQDLNIVYLINQTQTKYNTCKLTKIRITSSDSQQQQSLNIRTEYLYRDQQWINNIQQQELDIQQILVLYNTEFYFQNIIAISIQNINFTGTRRKYESTIRISKIKDFQIKNCIFYKNSLNKGQGAAIRIIAQTEITLQNVSFIENQISQSSSSYGAAIYLTDFSLMKCQDSSFIKNTVGLSGKAGLGGALFLSDNSKILSCYNCIFLENSANQGGAIYLEKNSALKNCFNCLFESNKAFSFGGAIQSEQSQISFIKNSVFSNNKQTGPMLLAEDGCGGAVNLLNQSKFLKSSNCSFVANQAKFRGGAICCTKSLIDNIPNMVFIQNSATSGGSIYLSQNSIYQNSPYSTFMQNNAKYGGALCINNHSTFQNSPNCIFFQNSGEQGGVLYINKYSVYSNSPKCKFSNNIATDSGGVLFIDKYAVYSNSSKCKFQNNSAKFIGGVLAISDYSNYSNSQNCVFKNNKAALGGVLGLVNNSNYINSQYCKFLNNSATISGGVLIIVQQSVYSKSPNCLFHNNTSLLIGGVFFIWQYSVYSNSPHCNFSNNMANFFKNIVNSTGGVLFIAEYSIYSNSSDCYFANNRALDGGVIQILDYSIYSDSPNCQFFNNTGNNAGVLLISNNSIYSNSPGCYFENNKAKHGGVLFITDNSIYQDSPNCTFYKNQAVISGAAIYLSTNSSYQNAANCHFFLNDAFQTGGAIQIFNQSTYHTSQNCTFEKNQAGVSGGAIYLYSLSNYTNSPSCLFIQNNAQQFGGAIYIYQQSTFLNSKNCTFQQNKAEISGGAVAISTCPNITIKLFNITFISNTANTSGGAVYSDLSSSIYIIDSIFTNNIAFSQNGGVLSFDQVRSIDQKASYNIINRSLFQNNYANQSGGAIYFQSIIQPSNISVINSYFLNNTAQSGGGIFLQSSLYSDIQNTKFLNNKAELHGGAIYSQLYGYIFTYLEKKTITLPYPLKDQIVTYFYRVYNPFYFNSNTFEYNRANKTAGAVYLDYYEFGQAQYIGLFFNTIYDITDRNKVNINLANFCLTNNIFKNNFANFGGAAIRINGFNVTEITNCSVYGSCPYLQNLIQQHNNTFTDNTSPYYKSYTPTEFKQFLYINQSSVMCTCIYGERLDQYPSSKAYYCLECQVNTYFQQYIEKFNVKELCKPCPKGFKCPGSHGDLELYPSYWTKTNLEINRNQLSIQAYECSLYIARNDTCLGYNICKEKSSICSYNSVCQKNYTGPACSVCNYQEGYYPQNKNDCLPCASTQILVTNSIYIIIIILILLILSIYLTRQKIQRQLQIKALRIGFSYIIIQKNHTTALIRIFSSYLTNISFFVISQKYLNYYVEQIFYYIGNLGQPLQVFSNSLECFVKDFKIDNLTQKQVFLLIQFIFSICLPTIIVILVYLPIYLLLRMFKKQQKFPIYQLVIPTYISLYLQFLPTLYYNSLSFLTCIKIADEKYIIGDAFSKCDSNEKGVLSLYNLLLAVPILFFQLIIPIILLFIVFYYKRKNHLNSPIVISSCKYQLGYLYLGYKENVYYWEFIRIAERLLISSSFLIFYDYGTQKNCFIVLILIFYSLLVHRYKPNDNIMVQTTEYLSNLVQVVTFIIGIIITQKLEYGYVQIIFLIIVVFINLGLITYILAHLLSSLFNSLIPYLTQRVFLQRFKFIKNFIVKLRKKRAAMVNWLNLRKKLDKIIRLRLQRMSELSKEDFQEVEIRNTQIQKKKLVFRKTFGNSFDDSSYLSWNLEEEQKQNNIQVNFRSISDIDRLEEIK